MPKKPAHPTIYPQQTRSSAIGALACLIARGAVRMAQSEDVQSIIEPDFEHKPVHLETSVNAGNIEMCSMSTESQPSLFGEDEE